MSARHVALPRDDVQVVELFAEVVRRAERPPQHRLVEHEAQLRGLVGLGEQLLATRPNLQHPPRGLLGLDRRQHLVELAGIGLGLQQRRHDRRGEAADRRGAGLVVDVGVGTGR